MKVGKQTRRRWSLHSLLNDVVTSTDFAPRTSRTSDVITISFRSAERRAPSPFASSRRMVSDWSSSSFTGICILCSILSVALRGPASTTDTVNGAPMDEITSSYAGATCRQG
ncbi:MAG: hypothetical protein BWY06_02371 [Candidatus Latescibacteria bacterium ADurb.Bin168]|nr:MAG: hypothetical protein BWY06_02371 [Candidatus Latescibacteria bacterium ADurb.Bin168]